MSVETMTKIGSITCDGTSSSVTFSNIPQYYTDLHIEFTTRSTATSTPSVRMSVNGSLSLQTTRMAESYTGAAAGTSPYTYTDGTVAITQSTSHSALSFGAASIYISNYTGNTFKAYTTDYHTESTTESDYMWKGFGQGVWQSTLPITSLGFSLTSGNFASNSTFSLYGIKNARKLIGNSVKAIGGNISFDGTYVIHTFNSSGIFTPTSNITKADYLVVAGGGGGGRAGGGGAGGLRSTVTATGGGGSLETAFSATAGNTYAITIGAGGTGSNGDNVSGASGTNSAISGVGITSITSSAGSGGGGGSTSCPNILQGGSGGGGSFGAPASSNVGGLGTANQGYAGGNGIQNGGGGGGGGAGQAGSNAVNGGTPEGGNGGNGVAVTISGSSVYYAGGGGGASHNSPYLGGSGGLGGGGRGGDVNAQNGRAGTPNTGGGGGGSHYGNPVGTTGLNGGSGIIIIRYKG